MVGEGGEGGRGAPSGQVRGQVLSRTSVWCSSTGCCHGGEHLAGCLHTPLRPTTKEQLLFY